MSVSIQETVFPYTGNGVTVTFPYNCQVQKAGDLDVYLSGALITSGFTINGVGSLSGGSVTFAVAPAAGVSVVLERVVDLERTTDYQQNGDFLARVVNPDFDRLWMALQQFGSVFKRVLRFPRDEVNQDGELPSAAARANNLLGFDEDGAPVAVAPSNQSATALAMQLLTQFGASMIGYIQAGAGAVRRTIEERLRDTVSVKDFGAKGDGATNDTAAFQKCETYARLNKKTMRAPAGVYMLDNFLFGTQNTTGQSEAPVGFVGDSREGTILRAIAGTTGTVFQGWSLAGVTFRDFSIHATGTAAQPLDLEWKPGVGPSTQNQIHRIRVDGGTAPTLVNLINLNDTYPTELSVNATTPSQCCIDARQPGGLLVMEKCIWAGGFLRTNAQNMKLPACWGFGIAFAANAVNNVALDGGYIYPNEWKGGTIWSESFDNFQSLHSITIGPGTQIITSANNGNWVFDINGYSIIKLEGVEFKSLGGNVNMWGPNCRRDSFQNVAVVFEGGSFEPQITMNEPAQFDISYRGLINRATGYAHKNSMKNYFKSGGNAGSFGANVWYELVPSGTLIEGVFLLAMKWDHISAGPPYLVYATATICSVASSEVVSDSGVIIPAVVAEFNIGQKIKIDFILTNQGTTATPQIQFRSSVPLLAPGVLTWTLTKLA